MPPETQYVDVGGAWVAYQIVEPRQPDQDGIDLVYMSGVASHVDLRWEARPFARFVDRLAAFARVILFDRRGSGASDPLPEAGDSAWEQWAEDLRHVLDAAGSQRPAVFATIDGGPVALMHAAAHPERTRALILANASARILAAPDYPQGLPQEQAEAMLDAFGRAWGKPDFAELYAPSAHLADDGWFAKMQRASMTPRAARAALARTMQLDLRSVLPSIQVPTLVLHAVRTTAMPASQGRYLADHIAGAVYREFDSNEATFIFSSTDEVLDEVERFLTGRQTAPQPDRMLATVLFTDIVGSTQRVSALGDREWRRLLELHDRLAHQEITAFGGRVWKSTGDGMMATFDAPGRAIRCVLRLQQQLHDRLDVDIRAGLHAGEVEVRDDDVSGVAVHIAARVAQSAHGPDVVISRTVADLVAGSGFVLVDQGATRLKGLSGEWNLYRVDQA